MIMIASQHILLTCFLWMWILYGVFTWEVRQRLGIYMNIKWESNLLNNSVINVVLVRHEKLPWNIHQNKIPEVLNINAPNKTISPACSREQTSSDHHLLGGPQSLSQSRSEITTTTQYLLTSYRIFVFLNKLYF